MSIKTFPEKVKFDWLENAAQYFDRGFQIIRIFTIFGFGNGMLLNKKLFGITTFGLKNRKVYLIKYLRSIFKTKVIFKSNLYFLSDIWSDGPYHFHIDVLSKLISLQEKKVSLVNINIVLTKTEYIKNIGLPILDYLKLNYKTVLLLNNNNQYLVFGRNYYLTKPHVMGSNNPSMISLLYDNLLISSLKINANKFLNITKVYYYRKNRKRMVSNDSILIPILESRGFYCTTFDDLSYFDVISLMSKVFTFVGIHGGGMTNMLFLKGPSNIIEIKTNNPNPQNHCYWHLARSLKFNYTMFVAESVDSHNQIEGSGCNVSVDITQMLTLLREFE